MSASLSQIALMWVEASLVAALLIPLFRLRQWLGLAPLYVAIGGFQYLQMVLASSIYVEVAPGILVSPGSVILFAASLSALLLVYIREDAIEARKFVYGVVATNVTLTALTALFGLHFNHAGLHNFIKVPQALFDSDVRVTIVGTASLVVDLFALIALYEWLSRHIAGWLFVRLALALTVVLALDTLLFVTGSFVEQPSYASLVLSGLVGKSVGALFFALVLHVYLVYFEPKERPLQETAELRDLFHVMSYRQRFESLKELVARDGLTQLYNRRFLDAYLPGELERSVALGVPTSVLMIDIDFFKQINDVHGHQEGDRVLVLLSSTLVDCIRTTDIACRFGGEEFAVVLPDAGADASRVVAERIRRQFKTRLAESGLAGGAVETSVTIGLATFPDEAPDAVRLIEVADRRLYRGKVAGRDRVVTRSEGSPAALPSPQAPVPG